MSEPWKVLVSDRISARGLAILENAPDVQVDNRPGLPPEELLSAIPGYHALIVRSATRVTADVIGAGAKLRLIARAGIGVDNVDLEAATRRGVLVMNAPEGNIITTAEHALAMLLALSRNIPQAVASLKGGLWERGKFEGVEVYDKVLGIIGLGRIGSLVAERARALGMRVLAHDPYISSDAAERRGVRLVELEALLREADYISLHVPKTPETENMLGRAELRSMKRGVRIINCARGGILDEEALLEALEEGIVAGAALDVYAVEPPGDNPLLAHERVICTPHLGASTREAQENVAVAVAEQVLAFFRRGAVKNAVNMPSLAEGLLEKVSPYMELGERLGSLLAQLVDGGIKRVSLSYQGRPVELGPRPVTASALQGLMRHFMQETVNLVNASHLAKERGIEVVERVTSEAEVFSDLISMEVETDLVRRSAAGTFFRPGDPRVVSLDSYDVEAIPEGYMLIFSNRDTPGVIGSIGTILGDHGINIAGMQLGRRAPKEMAVAIVNVDSPIPHDVMEKIRHLPTILDAKLVHL